MSKDLIICDIDGILADCEHRLHYLKEKNYADFYGSEILEDKLIKPGVRLLYYLWAQHWKDLAIEPENNDVIFLTGRPCRTRSTTKDWIARYMTSAMLRYPLLMRGDEDYRPSSVVKVELLKATLSTERYNTVYFIDDDPKNIKAVCEAFPNITGITFGIKRMEKK